MGSCIFPLFASLWYQYTISLQVFRSKINAKHVEFTQKLFSVALNVLTNSVEKKMQEKCN